MACMTAKVDVDFDCTCEECGREVTVTVSGTVIAIRPCAHCKEEACNTAFDRGYDAGVEAMS